MNISPAIVVIAFNRPRSIERLLKHLLLANYPESEVTLVISVDQSDCESGAATRKIAKDFQWPHGPRRVIIRDDYLGLRHHVLKCGDLTEEYGSIIMLEDDLSVSPEFYRYAVAALDFATSHESIAGVSLYSSHVNRANALPFLPLFDGFDNYYLQFGASWGQAWNRTQWRHFRNWYEALKQRDPESMERIPETAPIPRAVRVWPRTSWLKYFIWYLIESERLFLYPRVSYSTNHADRGTHSPLSSKAWHVPLAMRSLDFRFSTPEESLAVYDAFFEIWPDRLKRLYPQLAEYDFDVDLYGSKQRAVLQRPCVLTSRRVRGRAKLSFEIDRKPLEANFGIVSEQKNVHSFSLVETEQLLDESTMQISNLQTIRYFFNSVPIRDIVRNSLRYYLQKRKEES